MGHTPTRGGQRVSRDLERERAFRSRTLRVWHAASRLVHGGEKKRLYRDLRIDPPERKEGGGRQNLPPGRCPACGCKAGLTSSLCSQPRSTKESRMHTISPPTLSACLV
uniref:Astrotactin 1 n=1 Tax=Rousettus aegyptiacus TaxID=9407 RepID=A0A7J8BBU8_ROUAE|nr:astrotactin 1 [Rousettus aegyptiacus]